MRSKGMCIFIVCTVLLLGGCASSNTSKMRDGYYTAEAASFDVHGWKEYITIYVSENKIITVDYNAKNESGFIKSWDMNYMRVMNETDGTYPNKYTRRYAETLLNRQDPDRVDALTGATHSYVSFQFLARAAIEQAKKGDKKVVFVQLPDADDKNEG